MTLTVIDVGYCMQNSDVCKNNLQNNWPVFVFLCLLGLIFILFIAYKEKKIIKETSLVKKEDKYDLFFNENNF